MSRSSSFSAKPPFSNATSQGQGHERDVAAPQIQPPLPQVLHQQPAQRMQQPQGMVQIQSQPQQSLQMGQQPGSAPQMQASPLQAPSMQSAPQMQPAPVPPQKDWPYHMGGQRRRRAVGPSQFGRQPELFSSDSSENDCDGDQDSRLVRSGQGSGQAQMEPLQHLDASSAGAP